MVIFANRCEAGLRLAGELEEYRSADPVVLALPRGGVPIGFEVARALGAPLEVFPVRKLGAPGHAELAIGAVGPGGVTVLDESTIRLLGVPDSYLAAVIERERKEVARRVEEFAGAGPAVSVEGRTVILVDDGIATGATAEAAIGTLRQQRSARIVVAAPVAAPEAVERLRAIADVVNCVAVPRDFGAVGFWYRDFTQTTDDEVRQLLQRARLEWQAHQHDAATGAQ
jgi:predicted phosphoribosyltransferase